MENATKDSFTIVLTFRFPGGRDSNGESLWQKFWNDAIVQVQIRSKLWMASTLRAHTARECSRFSKSCSQQKERTGSNEIPSWFCMQQSWGLTGDDRSDQAAHSAPQSHRRYLQILKKSERCVHLSCTTQWKRAVQFFRQAYLPHNESGKLLGQQVSRRESHRTGLLALTCVFTICWPGLWRLPIRFSHWGCCWPCFSLLSGLPQNHLDLMMWPIGLKSTNDKLKHLFKSNQCHASAIATCFQAACAFRPSCLSDGPEVLARFQHSPQDSALIALEV